MTREGIYGIIYRLSAKKRTAEHIENRIEKQRKKKHTNNKVNFNGSQ